MREDIRKRWEMIQRGEVPRGYKKTKVGIIPEDWEVCKLENIAAINKLNLSNNTDEDYEFYYFDLSSVSEGEINVPEKKTRFGDLPSRARRIFNKNDTLMSTVRPYLKGFGYVDFEKEACLCSTGFAVITSNKKQDSKYIYQNIFSDNINNQIKRLLIGSNYPAINKEDIGRLAISYSKYGDEREKIADILSTWDEAIGLKEKLIEEKQEQKKGLMQNLLTGKFRLPGFEGEWEEVRLGDISQISTGNKDNKDKDNNGIYPFYVRSDVVERISTYSYDGEAILIPGDGRVGQIYHYIKGKFDYHQRVYKISDFGSNSFGRFIYYYLQQFFLREAMKFTAKATVDSLRMPMLRNMVINLPPFAEQKAIADVLSTADREIELLKEEVELLKEQKKGLMQLLLTGVVRVDEAIL